MAKINPGDRTIAAVATPYGEASVSIVRLSGPDAIHIVDKIFKAKSGRSLSTQKSFTLRYGKIFGQDSQMVDEVVVSVMRAPKSYTREDIVEINSHGGARAASAILELVLKNGAQLAEPGEFTKRAFLNGRLDLAQAEAVLDIIQSQSDLALKNSLAQLSGDVSNSIGELRSAILEILADIEARIDFEEEGSDSEAALDIKGRMSAIITKLNMLLERSFQGRIVREGLKVVIYGRPNVGKSSLLNAILKQERAIVTPIAGTTRDTIEEAVSIKGLAVRLIDTAGMLQHRDAIEKEAMNRTKKALESSDLVLFVVDSSMPLTEEDKTLALQVRDKKVIPVANKSDLSQYVDLIEAEALFGKKPISVSAGSGANIAALEDLIFNSVFDKSVVSPEGAMISNVRHIEIIKRTLMAMEEAQNTISEGLSLEFVSLDIKKALDILGELTGEVATNELLDVIFSKFCIGK